MKRKTLLFILCITLSGTLWSGENHIADKTLLVSLDSGGVDFNTIHSFSATEAQLFSGLYEGLVSYHPFTLGPPSRGRRRMGH